MAYKKVSNYGFNKKNPFLSETVNHVKKGRKTIIMGKGKKTDVIVGEGGEIVGHSVFMKKIRVDKAEFRKLYVTNIPHFFDLSKAGIRLFGYMATVAKINKADIHLDFEECMKLTGYKSKKTILTGISELLENSIIARGRNPYHYFINPTVFFNGDRLTFLEQYEQIEDNPNELPGQTLIDL